MALKAHGDLSRAAGELLGLFMSQGLIHQDPGEHPQKWIWLIGQVHACLKKVLNNDEQTAAAISFSFGKSHARAK